MLSIILSALSFDFKLLKLEVSKQLNKFNFQVCSLQNIESSDQHHQWLSFSSSVFLQARMTCFETRPVKHVFRKLPGVLTSFEKMDEGLISKLKSKLFKDFHLSGFSNFLLRSFEVSFLAFEYFIWVADWECKRKKFHHRKKQSLARFSSVILAFFACKFKILMHFLLNCIDDSNINISFMILSMFGRESLGLSKTWFIVLVLWSIKGMGLS